MASPRDQVTCRQCGAVLGQFADRKPADGHKPRLDLRNDADYYLDVARADVFCPDCGHCRHIDLTRYAVRIQRKAA